MRDWKDVVLYVCLIGGLVFLLGVLPGVLLWLMMRGG